MKPNKYEKLENNKQRRKLYTFGLQEKNGTENYWYDKFEDDYVPLFFYKSTEDFNHARSLFKEIGLEFGGAAVIECKKEEDYYELPLRLA